MTHLLPSLLVAAALAVSSTLSHSQGTASETRGSLLYTTHCIGCHTTQMHWRNDRQAHDWNSLNVQVRRWQGNAALQWSDEDIAEVARHLNDTIYHYPQPTDRVGMGLQRNLVR